MRRESKPEIEVRRLVLVEVADECVPRGGSIVRLSVAGAEIESPAPPGAGREVLLRAVLIEGEAEVSMRGRIQWSNADRFAVQFALLGARETSAIVRASRSGTWPNAR